MKKSQINESDFPTFGALVSSQLPHGDGEKLAWPAISQGRSRLRAQDPAARHTGAVEGSEGGGKACCAARQPAA